MTTFININNNNKREIEIAPETKQGKVAKSGNFRPSALKVKNPLRLSSSTAFTFEVEFDSDDETGIPTGFHFPFKITKPAGAPPAPPVKMGRYVPAALKPGKWALESKPAISDAAAGYTQFEAIQIPKYPGTFNPTAPTDWAHQMPEMVTVTMPKRQY